MVSLADIGPLSKKVTIRNKDLEVRGVNVHDIFSLLEQFPDLKSVISNRAVSGDVALSIIQGIPAAVGAIIACACGEADNKAAIGAAQSLSVGEQLEMLEAIAEMTFPKGVKSFVDGLAKLISQAGGDRGWAAAMNSREPAKSASATATAPSTSGDTLPDSLPDGAKSSTENEPAKT